MHLVLNVNVVCPACHRHATGYNAGLSVLYLGPNIIVVTEEDKQDIIAFEAKLQLKFSIYLPPTTTFRQLMFAPTHVAACQLQYCGSGLDVLPVTKSQKRRVREKRCNAPRRSRKRAKKGHVV